MQVLKKRPNNYGVFPCNSYLNNALRLMLNSNELNNSKIVSSIEEICWCIIRADGYFTKENIESLMLRNIANFVWDSPLIDIRFDDQHKYFHIRHGWVSDESKFICRSSITERVKEFAYRHLRDSRLLYFEKGG